MTQMLHYVDDLKRQLRQKHKQDTSNTNEIKRLRTELDDSMQRENDLQKELNDSMQLLDSNHFGHRGGEPE